MEYVKLGGSAITVSRLGFGCDPIGGHAWGAVDRDEATRAVSAAVDRGITLFDTADCYGLGESERLLGRALRGRRNAVVIASKFGVRIGNDGRRFYDNSPAWLDAALDASLARLGTGHIDLYQLHYSDGVTPLEAIFERLERKRDSGKIGVYGVTNIELPGHAAGAPPPGLVSFSFEYSLANRRNENRISRMADGQRLTFLSWGSLGQGVLTGKYDHARRPGEGDRRNRADYANFHGRRFERNLAIVDALRACDARSGGRRPAQTAMRWILDRFENAVVLAGIKSRAQLDENIGAMDWRLGAQEFAMLDRLSRAEELVAS
jgi:aryl-alcohol dehydrogenase-like predicted oxidoreductase